MPKIIPLNLAGPSYLVPDQPTDAQQSLNLYTEHIESGSGYSSHVLRPTSGLKLYVSAGTGPIRALYAATNGLVLCVSGSSLYKLVGASAVYLTTIGTGTGNVTITDNGIDALLVEGTATATVVNLTSHAVSTLALPCITDQCECCDSFFILKQKDSTRFYVSNVLSTVFDSLNFASAEGAPDPLQAIATAGREVWMFGTDTTEVWSNGGGAGFPFVRLPGVFIEQGTAAPNSVQVLAGSIYWLGRARDGQGVIWRSNSYAPERISTHAIERALSTYTRISDAYSASYIQDGHAFYCLSFPSMGKTFVYDAITEQWHERASLDASGARLDVWKPKVICPTPIGILCGDSVSGSIYLLDQTQASENGTAIIRRRILPYTGVAGRALTHNALTIDMMVGTGLQGNTTKSPQLMLRYSDDFGATWSNERWTNIGALGERRPRVRFTRLGQSRHRLYELSYADAALLSLTSATLEVSDG